MTTLLKQFEEAEKSGNWVLHINSVQKMIPFFHASGHNNYAESAHIYLQDMLNLKNDLNEKEFANFVTNGFFTVRRTVCPCCGVYTDQTIEHVLMAAFKSRYGGVINRGLLKSVISKWVGSYVGLLDIINALMEHCKVDMSKTDQHVQSRLSSIDINKKHLLILCDYFANNEPFPNLPSLISLDTGLIGDETVDCHLAYEKGLEVLNRITGSYFSNLQLKRRDKVIPLMAMSSSILVNDQKVAVNPNSVFQRIVMSSEKTVGLKGCIDYELAPFPASLFDGVGFRKTQKSKLYSLFNPLENINLSSNIFTVIDGGYMLHRVPWKNSDHFETICDKYYRFIEKYKPCIVVFDNYPDNKFSTKLYERLRRSSKRHSNSMLFLSEDQPCGIMQEDFLSNIDNKKLLINRLSEIFNSREITTIQAEEDADSLIVNTAIEKTSQYDAVQIIGDDVDLIVLMTQFGKGRKNLYLNKYDKTKKSSIFYDTDSFKYENLSPVINFLHAWGGCDTTSAFFNQGKEKVFKIFSEDSELLSRAHAFYDENANPEVLWQIALDIVSEMYVKKSASTFI